MRPKKIQTDDFHVNGLHPGKYSITILVGDLKKNGPLIQSHSDIEEESSC